jgi:hypothetical protein
MQGAHSVGPPEETLDDAANRIDALLHVHFGAAEEEDAA